MPLTILSAAIAAAPAGAAAGFVLRFPMSACVNAVAVVVGSILGLAIGKFLKEETRTAIFIANGLATFSIGVGMALKTGNAVIMVMAIVSGVLVGELLRLDDRLNAAAERLQQRLHVSSGSRWAEGLVTATLIYCIGPMTIIGSIQEGMTGNGTLIYTKSILDLVISISLAAALGSGVAFSAIPVLVIQGSLTLLGSALGFLMEPYILNELTATGGLMVVAIGINLLGIKKIKLANFLPGLVFAVLYSLLVRARKLV
ncbi:MAG: DUF554 domain-containing protein [Caldisericota bacterium]|nr:DUF554 domain-containing protein [Caldisericota bacterium]